MLNTLTASLSQNSNRRTCTVLRKASTFAFAKNSGKFASSCHDVPVFSDHLCAEFGDESHHECHALDIGRPLFIKEMDVRGDFR